MATKQGRRFGEEKPVQRNKETKNPNKPNRSPGQSNANRRAASLKEDVGTSTKEDVKRVSRGVSPTGKSALTRTAQQEAAKRAAMRLGSRAGYMGAALSAGYGAGSVLADKAIEKMAEGKVKLSDYAKQRMQEEEDFKAMEKSLRESAKEQTSNETQRDRWFKKAKEFSEAQERQDKKMAKGGMSTKQQAKVGTVMKEFKAGSLHSGKGGKVVKNPRQAVAIALSEARKKKA